MKSALPAQKDGPRINEEIRSREVQLIGGPGRQQRHLDTRSPSAWRPQRARSVEITQNSVPPISEILDYGKYKSQAQKKAAEARRKKDSRDQRDEAPADIDDHDYDVKMRSMRFIDDGDKVKITLRFRGREISHQELGYDS